MKRAIPVFRLHWGQDFIGEVPMNDMPFLVGRRNGCSLRLVDQSVSREHLRFTLTEAGELLMDDLQSTNGTQINGKKILQGAIHSGDVITVGRLSLLVTPIELSEYRYPTRRRWSLFRPPPPRTRIVKGPWAILADDFITQFDAVAYAMSKEHESSPSRGDGKITFLRRIPRLHVIAQSEVVEREITQFTIPVHLATSMRKTTEESSLTTLELPKLRLSRFRIPWTWIERVVIPSFFVVGLVIAGRTLLPARIASEFDRADQYLDRQLSDLGRDLQYADDSVYRSQGSHRENNSVRRTKPLSLDEVWRRVDASPVFRNFFLIDLLDSLMKSEEIRWSLDEAMRNLPQLKSVTDRLPSVRSIRIVLAAETIPLQGSGMKEGRLYLLRDGTATNDSKVNYSEFQKTLGARLQFVASCAGARTSSRPAQVVLAFTVAADGRPKAVFVDEARSSKESALWSCVREKVSSLSLSSPPGGALSVVYTFKFDGTKKVEF